MFTATFETDCPFAAFMRKNPNKSFVRIVDYVRYAAIDYNLHNPVDFEDPRRIFFNYIRIYDDNPNDLTAHMIFGNHKGDKWTVTITGSDE